MSNYDSVSISVIPEGMYDVLVDKSFPEKVIFWPRMVKLAALKCHWADMFVVISVIVLWPSHHKIMVLCILIKMQCFKVFLWHKVIWYIFHSTENTRYALNVNYSELLFCRKLVCVLRSDYTCQIYYIIVWLYHFSQYEITKTN